MGFRGISLALVALFGCNQTNADKDTTSPTTPTGDSGEFIPTGTPTASTGTTGTTADTGLEPPMWTETLLQQMTHPREITSNGAVFAVDDEVWLMWEVRGMDGDALNLERHIAGSPTERTTVSTLLSAANESTTPALRGHADWDEVVVQKRVDCDPAIHGVCATIPSELELVFIDRTTLAPRIEPIVVSDLQAIEKGRGSLDMNEDGLFACFKARFPNPIADELHCIERDRLGNTAHVAITDQVPGSDDHPSVALRALDARRYVAFTSDRSGPRSTFLATDDSGEHIHDPSIRSEDAMITQSESGELNLVWAEHLVPTGGAAVVASCSAADCRDPAAWTTVQIDTGPDLVVAPAITMHEGRPVIAYGIGPEVHLAIRCDDGWRVERPWDHGHRQWTQRGQSSISGSTNGALHLVISEEDAQGVQQTWWGQRTGALCPELP